MATLMAPIATGALLVAAGCSTSEAGTPRAAAPGPRPTSESSKTPTSTSSGASPIAELDPCTLMSDTDRASLDVKSGEPEKLGDIKVCDWLKSGDFGLAVALHPTRGFKNANLQGSAAASVRVGKHQAHKVENLGGGNGNCDIFLEVNASSMAQIQGTDSAMKDTPKACDLAMRLAQIVDPKLP